MITVTAWVNGQQTASLLDYWEAHWEVTSAEEQGDGLTITVDNSGTLITNEDGDQFHYAGIYADLLDEHDIPEDVRRMVGYGGPLTHAECLEEERRRLHAERAAWEASLPDYDQMCIDRIAAGLPPF